MLTDEQSTAAFNMLQDRFGKPHAASIWYEKATDSYKWIGPKFHELAMCIASMPETIQLKHL
jgi:hypothetical protein